MTKDQLVAKLEEMRAAGEAHPRGRVGAMQHLFGIIFDKEIAASGATPGEIAGKAGVPATENISDGRNLAAYVTVKPEEEKRWRGGCGRPGDAYRRRSTSREYDTRWTARKASGRWWSSRWRRAGQAIGVAVRSCRSWLVVDAGNARYRPDSRE